MLRDVFGRPIDRRLLRADDGAGGDAEESDDADAGDTGGTSEQEQPYATFKDQRSFSRRMERETNARLRKLAEELGFESVESMQDAARAKRDADEQAKSELERANDAKSKAEQERDAVVQRANQRVVLAEARAVALELGVATERVSYAVKLADLSQVAVDGEGRPDTDAVKTAIEAVLQDVPELKGAPATERSGSDFSGGNEPPRMNPWKRESRNLSEQGRIMQENPALAKQLMREAGARG